MKRIFYILLTVIIFFIGLTFAFKNSQGVEVNYYFGLNISAPLSLVIIFTIVVGVGMGYLVSLRRIISAKRDLAQARKEIGQVEQEVENLRSLPIKDVI